MVLEVIKYLDKTKLLEDEAGSIFPHVLDQINKDYDGLAFCLSENADLLSQWRGYADDGRGVCIGFSKAYLESLHNPNFPEYDEFPLQLRRVLYDIVEQGRALEDVYTRVATRLQKLRAIMKDPLISEKDRDREQSNLIESIFIKSLNVVNNLFTLKSKAFIEEAEWRLIATVNSATYRLGEFRPTPASLIPFQTIPLKPHPDKAIMEVILGPKNQTPIPIVSNFLSKHNHSNAAISRSAASYR